MNLQTKTEDAGRLYTRYTSLLEKLNVITLEDLLFHIPFRYDDYSLISTIGKLQEGEKVTVHGVVVRIDNIYTKSSKKLQKAKIRDETGEMDIVWFNQPYLTKVIKAGDRVALSGRVGRFMGKLTLESPEYEVLSSDLPTIHTGRLVPVYPETRGVSSKWLRRRIFALLQEFKDELYEYLPEDLIEKNGLMTFPEAVETIHFPKNLEEAVRARERLAFDELLMTHLSGLVRKQTWKNRDVTHKFSITKYQQQIQNFWENLPFELTAAQKRAVSDIFHDLSSEKPMNRLLEGDVGSGKTVVGAIAMYVAYLNGFQSVLMAPTEILANQHYKTISDMLTHRGVRVALVTGTNKSQINTNKKEKHLKFDILIGTHAVLSEKITFDRLGLAIIDEQQRFGVAQRSFIREKGKSPHVLSMTATPIPRTVALTLYGELELSFLDEMPKGRKIVKTWVVPEEKRNNAYDWIHKQILTEKTQAFILCPFIEESETMQTVKAATKEFERLVKNVFPDLKLALLHGKLKSKEKTEILGRFREGEWHILVATPVVEVGIDIPNATIMLVEASERFGLSQLHQLRGRVGRSDKQSYCLLFTESRNDLTLKRLKAMETMHVGAQLAELDLKLRGPGDMYGTMQHGYKGLKIASFSDFPLIERTRREAERLFPQIHTYQLLSRKLAEKTAELVSPD